MLALNVTFKIPSNISNSDHFCRFAAVQIMCNIFFSLRQNNSSNNTASTSLNTMSSIWRDFFRKNRFFFPPSLGNLNFLPALIYSFVNFFYLFQNHKSMWATYQVITRMIRRYTGDYKNETSSVSPLILLLSYKDLKSIFYIINLSKFSNHCKFPGKF